MDSLSRCQGKPWLDILGIGKPLFEWLLEILGNYAERHPRNADQLLDLLLEELGGHSVLALDEPLGVAELADSTAGYHPAECGLQCGASLSVQAQGCNGQAALVREDRFYLLGKTHQLGVDTREGYLHYADLEEYA